MSLSDNLFRDYCAGSSDSFEKLVSLHQHELYTVATCLTESEVDAEFAMSTAFLKLLDETTALCEEVSVRCYLIRTLIEECSSLRRMERVSALEIVNDSEKSSEAELLKKELQMMPIQDAAPFVLRRVLGINVEEVADTLGVTRGNLATKLFRTYRRLQRHAVGTNFKSIATEGQNNTVAENI